MNDEFRNNEFIIRPIYGPDTLGNILPFWSQPGKRRELTPKERAKRKTRLKMAKESRKRNRKK